MAAPVSVMVALVESKVPVICGVFVNESRERVEEIGRAAELDVAQLHGGAEGYDSVN